MYRTLVSWWFTLLEWTISLWAGWHLYQWSARQFQAVLQALRIIRRIRL